MLRDTYYKHGIIRLLNIDIVRCLTQMVKSRLVCAHLASAKKSLRMCLSKHHGDAAGASYAGDLGRKDVVIFTDVDDAFEETASLREHSASMRNAHALEEDSRAHTGRLTDHA
jgi:hypothetical protein